MDKALKVVHLVGVAIFLGSIPGHVLLGSLVSFGEDPQGFALLQAAKATNANVLTVGGFILAVLGGVAMAVRKRPRLRRERWLAVKLSLVGLVALNAVLVLLPAGDRLAALAAEGAATGVLPDSFAAIHLREDLFGAANLVMILAIIALSVTRWKGRA